MNPHEESDNYVYEKLYEAIMKSIVSSPEVEEILRDLQAASRIDSMAVMNVILSLEELSNLIHSGSSLNDRESVNRTSNKQKKSPEEDFDEAQWLKKIGIRF